MSKAKEGRWSGTRIVAFRVNSQELEDALTEIKELGFDQSEFIRNSIIEALKALKTT